MLNKKIEFGNDGYHYIRAIGKDQVQVEKVIYGFRDEELYNKVTKQYDGEIFFDNSENQKMVEAKQIPPELQFAINTVQRINNLWEEGYSEITPHASNALLNSIKIINRYLPSNNQTLNILDRISEYLHDNATILTLNDFNISDSIVDSIVNQLT